MNKIIKKIILAILLFVISSPLLATNINFSTNKTSLSTDDTLKVTFSADGPVDNNRLEINGIKNDFDIIGKSTSIERININGKIKQTYNQILLLQPQKSGKFKIWISAKENGKEIKSKEVTINVKKSLTEQVKDNLLKSSQNDLDNNTSSDNKDSNNQDTTDNLSDILQKISDNDTKNNSKNIPVTKDLLKKSQNTEEPTIQTEKISEFNFVFWVKLLLILLIFLILFIITKKYIINKNK